MNSVLPPRVPVRVLSLFTLLSFVFLMARSATGNTLDHLQNGLPKKISGWTADAEDRIYDEKSIFRYIDGAAEVYRAYHMQRCLSRNYRIADGPGIVLDIFDMGSPQDAFGVFTHDTDGKPVNIGQDARYRPGWLSFWKHRFFVSIYMEAETPAAEKAVMELGKAVASLVQKQGERPRIISKLPREGLLANDIRYLHHPVILNYHFYLADENILNLSAQTEAVLASYKRGKAGAQFLLIRYPDSRGAKKSLENVFRHYLPDAGPTGAAMIENKKWAAAAVKERLLAIVLEADSRALAENLLKGVK
jgi:hypothetical protein